MPVKPKKTKQKLKQKQKQSQKVVVNINTGRAPGKRRRTPARRSGGGGSVGGGVGAFSSPIYLNAPSDLSPIIQNLPAQYQHLPAITMPTNTAPQPSLQALTYPTPTTLQTTTEDVRPLGASARGGSVDTSMTPVSIDTGPPKPRFKPPTTTLDKDNKVVQLIEKPASFGGDLFSAISKRKKKIESGESIIPMVASNYTREESPFKIALRESSAQRQSRAGTPTVERAPSPTLATLYPSLTSGFESPARMPAGFGLSSPSGLGGFSSSRASRASSLASIAEPIGKPPRARRQDISHLTAEEKVERDKLRQAEYYQKAKAQKAENAPKTERAPRKSKVAKVAKDKKMGTG